MAEVWLLAPIVALALTVEAIVGFGATVVTVALGAFLLPLDRLLAIYVPVNLLLSGWIVARHGRHADRTMLLRQVLPAMGVGLALGLAWLPYAPGSWLLLGFGGFVAVLAALGLVAHLRSPAAESPGRGGPVVEVGALVLAGVIHGLYGSGGPLVVWAAGRRLTDKSRFRSTLAVLWLVLNLVLVGRYATLGRLDAGTLAVSGALVPVLIVAILLGDRIHGRVPQKPFRLAVDAVLLLAGVALVVRTV